MMAQRELRGGNASARVLICRTFRAPRLRGIPQTKHRTDAPPGLDLVEQDEGLLRRRDIVARLVEHGAASALDAQFTTNRFKVASEGKSPAHILRHRNGL